MSTIFNQLVKHRIEEFNQCNPKGSGKWDVKPGEVVISELHPTPIGIYGETMFCDANWRPHCYVPFLEGLSFKMNTDVLYNSVSSSNQKVKPAQQLLGEMVYITSPATSYYTNSEGKTFSKYNVKWGVIAKDPEFETLKPKAAGLYALVNTGSKAKTLGEAVENFYAQSGEELRDATYLEGYAAVDELDWHQPNEDYDFDLDSDEIEM